MNYFVSENFRNMTNTTNVTYGNNSPIIIGNNNKVSTGRKPKMKRKDAFLTKFEKSSVVTGFALSVDFRAPKENYIKSYTKEQLDYLFSNGYLEEYEKVGERWENSDETYWQWTKSGKRWRIWYTNSMKTILKIYVFRLYWFRTKWERFRIACGHHYDWQDYEGMDITDI